MNQKDLTDSVSKCSFWGKCYAKSVILFFLSTFFRRLSFRGCLLNLNRNVLVSLLYFFVIFKANITLIMVSQITPSFLSALSFVECLFIYSESIYIANPLKDLIVRVEIPLLDRHVFLCQSVSLFIINPK